MTQPKPRGLGPEYAAQFQDPAVVAAYHHRPPYPAETFDILVQLLPAGGEAARVLDLGCGTGDLARPLAARVAAVDAVDVSAGMIARGRALPGGDRPNLHWIAGRAEDAPLRPPYGLVVAGESLHWMEWDIVLPRLRRVLAPGAVLALVGRTGREPWWDELLALIQRSSTNRDYEPYDLVAELTRRGLFRARGRRRTEPVAFRQSLADYVESIHSRNGFSRDRMTAEQAASFDADASALVRQWTGGDDVELPVSAAIVWGEPLG
ncbi:MAG TPA: class I SAM-dependent methyltransferase [Thermomicrobiaceae bacterium]|nr:class I SAM-dependent methyltransferase [Thermomicrobiaceae bacterium]